MSERLSTSIRCPIKAGTVLGGRYVVESPIGSGSSGWVLRVTDDLLDGEEIALKVFYPHLTRDEQSLARLRREVAIARQLMHPGIVHVHDFEANPDGYTFLAMEYVHGVNLATLLDGAPRGGLPPDEAILILSQLGEALIHAHQQGIVHRDLKPSNVLVGYDGRIRLCDFGVAKSFECELGLTRTGEAPGTPEYMAPEQFYGKEADQRTDVYAFGLIAYELLTGGAPFRDDDYFRLAELHLNAPLPPLPGGSQVPPWLRDLIRACCEKDPQGRPQSLADIVPSLVQALRPDVSLHVRDPRRNPWYRIPRRARLAIVSVMTLLVAWGLFEWAYAQGNVRVLVVKRVSIWEVETGHSFDLLRSLLRIHVSFLSPQSVFEVVNAQERRFELQGFVEAVQEVSFPHPEFAAALTVKDEQGYLPFERALRSGVSDSVSRFKPTYVKFDRIAPDGETPVTYLVKQRRSDLLEILQEFGGFQASSPNSAGETPLHIAVRLHNVAAFESLTRNAQTPLDRHNADGLTPAHLAVQLSDFSALGLIVQRYPAVSFRDRSGRTPLMSAIGTAKTMQQNFGIVCLLFHDHDIRSTVQARDNEGSTTLHYAVRSGVRAYVYWALRNGADASARDTEQLTARDYAERLGDAKVSQLFEGPVSAELDAELMEGCSDSLS